MTLYLVGTHAIAFLIGMMTPWCFIFGVAWFLKDENSEQPHSGKLYPALEKEHQR